MRYFLLITLIILSLFTTKAQSDFPYVHGEVLVQTETNNNISNLILSLAYYHGLSTQANVEKLVSKQLSIWKISFNPEVISHDQMLIEIKRKKSVIDAQFNYIMKKRSNIIL